jgi:SAM-dependent methyltransferase
MEDWRDPRARSQEFKAAVLEDGLPFEDAEFDLVFSFNTFEHVCDPDACLREILRLLRPAGIVHLSFGPLYCSAWGLHAYRSLTMPYPQWLFSHAFIERKLADLGIRDLGRERATLQPLNQWRARQFDRLWSKSGCRVIDREKWDESENIGLILQYPECFSGRDLLFEDVAVSGVNITLQKEC